MPPQAKFSAIAERLGDALIAVAVAEDVSMAVDAFVEDSLLGSCKVNSLGYTAT